MAAMNYKFIPARWESLGWDQGPKMIVIHWTAGNFASCIKTFGNGDRKASAHFIVNTDGEIVQMVSLKNRAWHAGKSSTQLLGPHCNNYSIGIELAGPPSILKQKEWDQRQINATKQLIKEICENLPSITHITDHSTISPGRKIDVRTGTGKPEDLFPWNDLIKDLNLIEI
jgi:N-acetyl-anhydromuramyl-L-alanine amidase AmpD